MIEPEAYLLPKVVGGIVGGKARTCRNCRRALTPLVPRARRIVRDYYPGQVERGAFIPRYDRTVGYVDVNVMDSCRCTHRCPSTLLGMGLTGFCFFLQFILVHRKYMETRCCFFLTFWDYGNYRMPIIAVYVLRRANLPACSTTITGPLIVRLGNFQCLLQYGSEERK